MGSAQRFFAAALSGLLVGACAGSPVSLTAQRGSSILVPVGRYRTPAGEPAPTVAVGFGRPQQPGTGQANAAWVDAQRGEFEFYVDDGQDAGEVFLLRATSVSDPDLASPYARAVSASWVGSDEVAALLDVPADAPLGQQTLRYRNKQAPATSAVIGDVWILPHEVLLCEAPTCGAPAGTPVVTGQSTPIVNTAQLKRTIPDPQVVIPLPAPVHAIEFGLKFPTSIATVVDAYEHRTDRKTDLAWVTVSSCTTDCPPLSQYRVKAVALGDQPIESIAIVFSLLGSTPVVPAAATPGASQVRVFPLLARDENGETILEFPEGGFLDSATFYVE